MTAGAPEVPRVAIAGTDMADAHTVRVAVTTAQLSRAADPPVLTLVMATGPVSVSTELPLSHMPNRFAILLDLKNGRVLVGGIPVGTFPPLPPPTDNLRLPVTVTVREGPAAATSRAVAEVLLPTVIVPGYRNERTYAPGPILAEMEKAGYIGSGPVQTVFWASYRSGSLALQAEAAEVADYVHRVVRPIVYASRINVIGYSVGGLAARWNIAENADGWARLVNRLVLVGAPNEGMALAYIGDRSLAGFPFTAWAHGPLVRDLYPTFPYWRAKAGEPWTTPPGGAGTTLTQLRSRDIPESVRVYVLYGNNPRVDGSGFDTVEGITGALPTSTLSFGAGDGLVLAASAQGLPIHGDAGDPVLRRRVVCQVDVGPVYHTRLLRVAMPWIVRALRDHWDEGTPAPSAAGTPRDPCLR
ncbi:MAG TPA: hypothetical protein VEZ44_12750 [bacterium]|nr:hypothetical protein [bacterium]